MSTFDLNFLSLYRINGNEWPLMPGLLALNPPRKAARGREQDRLIVYLTLAGNVAYTPAEYGEMAVQIADRFYNTSGSITLGLKTAVESLNTYLMERNRNGQHSIAALVLAALRGDALYITQCGPTHAYWLMNGEARHFYDAGLAGKGLGLNDKAQMYFAQINLNANDRVLFCTALPPNWDKSFADERGSPTLESTRRRLLAITDTNVSAVLFQAVEGTGAMNIIRAGGEVAKVAESAPVADTAPTPLVLPTAQKKQPASTSSVRRPEKPLLTPQQREQLARATRQTAGVLAHAMQASRKFFEKVGSSLQTLIPRLLPGEQEAGQAGFPGSWLAFFAIAFPILVLTIGVLIYTQIGRPAVFESFYQKALAAAEDAKTEQDPTRLRTDWETVLGLLTTAEAQYLVPERAVESRNLRQQAQKALDQLNRIIRVQYRPAFSTQLRSIRVTRMAATDVDLYLLDNVTGSVIHGNLNGQTYNTDPGFDTCKPGTYNGIQVGMLIDIIALPRANGSGASLIAIDGAGNLLYCASEEKPRAASLQKPEKGWQSITAIAYDANSIYLLDSLGSAVWLYSGTGDLQFPDQPFFVFESQVPEEMEQTVGMTINGNDLYLLHTDGHLTTCILSRIETVPTLCNNRATLVDTRPGYESSDTLLGAVFSQITFTSPPDPAVALLEPHTQSIYRFSARALELQHEIAPPPDAQNRLPNSDVTAMAFSPNKVVFLFVRDQVYYAVNIP